MVAPDGVLCKDGVLMPMDGAGAIGFGRIGLFLLVPPELTVVVLLDAETVRLDADEDGRMARPPPRPVLARVPPGPAPADADD